MVNITLSVPEELKEKMDKFKEINWSEIARQAIRRRIILLREMDDLLKNSKLTEEDAIRLGREVNRRVARKLLGK
jgi:hypothetical protein